MLLDAELYDVSVDYIKSFTDAYEPCYSTVGASGCHGEERTAGRWHRHCAPTAGGGVVDLNYGWQWSSRRCPVHRHQTLRRRNYSFTRFYINTTTRFDKPSLAKPQWD